MRKFFGKLFMYIAITFIVLGIVVASITSAANSDAAVNKPMKVETYKDSISAVTMCNLAAEASKGELLTIYEKHMDFKDNNVKGWSFIEEHYFDDGLSYALWVNNFRRSTYCLVYAGTDEIKDMKDYIPMETKEERSSQTQNAAKIVPEVAETVARKHAEDPVKYGALDYLIINGHSLGGYLAMYIASDLVDSVVLENPNVLVGVKDLGWNDVDTQEEIDAKLRCFTIGAPGMHFRKPLLGIEQTSWQKQKVDANDKKIYHTVITQYVNLGDIVPTLLSEHLDHIGRKVVMRKPKVSFATKTTFFNKHRSVVGFGASYLIYYHMPWVYVNLLSR